MEEDLAVPQAKPLVLVAHDDADLRDALQFALGLEGAVVRTHDCARGLLADEGLRDCACLVLKLHLPDRDGLELLRELRARAMEMPAILLTSAATAALRARARAAGVQLVLEKPIMDDALVRAVAAFLREIT